MIMDQDIDMLRLILFTPLPELWSAFQTILSISPLDSNGYLTISMAGDYIKDTELDVTHSEFWRAMTYFLDRKNQAIYAERNKKGSR